MNTVILLIQLPSLAYNEHRRHQLIPISTSKLHLPKTPSINDTKIENYPRIPATQTVFRNVHRLVIIAYWQTRFLTTNQRPVSVCPAPYTHYSGSCTLSCKIRSLDALQYKPYCNAYKCVAASFRPSARS